MGVPYCILTEEDWDLSLKDLIEHPDEGWVARIALRVIQVVATPNIYK